MKAWKKAYASLKDRNSVWIASLGRRTISRNPILEKAVIKATNHNEFSFDDKNVEIVYQWIRDPSANLKPVLYAISTRMEKTRCWVVALKGLMLMHGIYTFNNPAIKRIGRLPFDLSYFKDEHTNPIMTWDHNRFIRSYYKFLDQKSTLLSTNFYDRKSFVKDNKQSKLYPLMQELVVLQKFQDLLDMLLQIRPQSDTAIVPLILEAMTGVVIEIFDAYGRICSGIAKVLVRIYSAGKVEAAVALRIVQKATVQGEEVALFFEFCRELGVMTASQCPKVEQISDKDIKELKEIIDGVPEDDQNDNDIFAKKQDQAKAIVVREPQYSKSELKTVITNDWETFEEDWQLILAESLASEKNSNMKSMTPFPEYGHGKVEDLPDLISFL